VEILGGDVSVGFTYRFASKKELNFIKGNSSSFTETTNFRSMAIVSENNMPLDSTLIQVKGVDNNYPLYGKIEIIPNIPISDALKKIDGVHGLIVAEPLLNRLNLVIGDQIQVGNNFFDVRALLITEPDAGGSTFSFAPRVIAYNEGLIESGLLTLGTMFDTDYKLKAPGINLNQIKEKAGTLFQQSGMRWKDSSEASPGIDRFVERLSLFLSLIGMAGLAIGGIGVALSLTVYLESKNVTIATLKTLGATDTLIFKSYFLIILTFAITGSTFGSFLGALLPIGFGPILASKFPIPIVFDLYYQPILSAIYYGILTALVFSSWPLGKMINHNVSTLIRNSPSPKVVLPHLRYQLFCLFNLLLLIFSFSLRSPQPLISIGVFCGIAISLFSLLIMARGIKIICSALTRTDVFRNSLKIRLALSSISGPNSEVSLTMLSVGLGLIVLATIGQIDHNLRYNIDNDLQEKGPTFFLLDIQNSQLLNLEESMLSSGKVSTFSSAPMMRGIISKINGIPAEDFAGDHWAIRGDRGLTYSEYPPQNGKIIEGEWWEENYSGDPVISFTANEAKEIGLSIGDKITVNVLGRDIVGTLTNFRDVNWASMQINFLMMFNPSALEAAPHSHIATIYSDASSEASLLRKISKGYPNITAIPMRDTLKQVSETLSTIASITRWSSIITIVIGFVVLVGVSAATERKRSYEACLLKTLGASNSLILLSFTLRSAIIGAGAGIMAITVGNISGWAIVSLVMGLPFNFDSETAITIILIGIITNLLAGLIFSQKPLSASISKTLRQRD
jgi:putative ABC transport system permease protein